MDIQSLPSEQPTGRLSLSQALRLGQSEVVALVGGGARGANEGSRDEVQVVKNCLRGRGYKILN